MTAVSPGAQVPAPSPVRGARASCHDGDSLTSLHGLSRLGAADLASLQSAIATGRGILTRHGGVTVPDQQWQFNSVTTGLARRDRFETHDVSISGSNDVQEAAGFR